MKDSGSSEAQSALVKLLADNAADVIYRIRLLPEPAYEYISPSVEAVLGYSPAEFYADVSLGFRIVHPDDREKAMDPGAPPPTLRAIHRDGSIVHFEQRHRLIQDESGAVVAIEGVCRNVSERVAIEEARRRSEANFRSVIELSPMLVGVIKQGEIVYANEAVARCLGVPREELLGSAALDFVEPEDRELRRERVEGGLDEGQHGPPTLARARRRDGSVVTLETTSLGIMWDGARAILVVGRDVSEREQLLTRLAASERLASLGTLAAGVAHEINNPLSYVTVAIELALRALENPSASRADAVAALKSASDGAARIARVVRDIHAFARSEPMAAGPVDVIAAVERSVELTRNQVRHRARLVRDFADVPLVQADEARLVQVFVNLIANAADAIEAHGAGGEIRIATRARESEVVIEVSDTGAGISASQLAHVFDPFFTTKAVGRGMGLGLSICHGIVTQLGGSIQVESELGRGATFRVSLPQARAITGPRTSTSERDQLPRRARILFIDDEVKLCEAMAKLLEPEHDVVTMTRAEQALELVRSGERFDMILCDLMMPGMTGKAFFEALRRLPGVDPSSVVFMTGGAFGTSAQDFLSSLPNACFSKPLDLGKIRKWLGPRLVGSRTCP